LTIADLQAEIIRLKKEHDICILAHSYQTQEICEVADFTGDSYQLSVKAETAPNGTVAMCGVRFMAETVKILSPEKKVILVNPDAGCPMAEQMNPEYIADVKKKYPDYTVVAYINTTAALKTICDVCVTSSSAVKICKNIENDKILFIPDCNLGDYVSKKVPDKTFKFLNGGCPIHARVMEEEAIIAKMLHPNALLLVHPECIPSVTEKADYAGSTSGIMQYVRASDAEEFIIGTEIAILQHLQYEFPDKKFYHLSKKLVCPNMKSTSLVDLYNAMRGAAGEEIELDEDTRLKAKSCIDKMIEFGG